MEKTRQIGLSRRALAAGIAGLSMSAFSASALAQIKIDFGAIGRMLKNLSFDEEDEIALGEGLFGPLIQSSGGLYRNRNAQSSISNIAQKLFETTSRDAFSWQLAIIDNNEVNAWALPGGKIGVNKGLLRYVENEDELAAVIAHEMGHAELSHATKEMRKKAFYAGLSSAAQTATAAAVSDKARAGTQTGMKIVEAPMMRLVASGYSRDLELEADMHILKAFESTGYDVTRGAGFYETLLELIPQGSKGTTSLFAGHPETQKRLTALREAGAVMPSAEPAFSYEFFALKETFPTRKIYKRAAG